MVTQFELIDPPELIEIKHYQIEDEQGRHLHFPFVHFRWSNRHFWLLGRMVWRNTMALGEVYLRLPRGKKLFEATMVAHPHQENITFTVNRPRDRSSARSEAFVFMGFSLKYVVNIDFVREEDQRISTVPNATLHNKKKKFPRPPAGHIV